MAEDLKQGSALLIQTLKLNEPRSGRNKSRRTLPKTLAPADLVEEIKKSSSKWIKTKEAHYNNFYWQDGYGGFSFSNSGVDTVKKYILNQKKYHEKVSFLDEYKNLLEAYGILYEERYL
ncbi:MAG: transposase [Bacteroidales bacterium]